MFGDYKYIDLTYLVEMSDSNKDLMIEMIGIFTTQVTDFSKQLNVLYKENNYFELGRLAHKAKSSVSIMGMTDLAKDLKELENNAKENLETESYEATIIKFCNETEGAIQELKDVLEKLN